MQGRHSLEQIARRFESLGGGSSGGWGFGCEFGFFQRHAGIEPLGLLRWASIDVEDLIKALDTEFSALNDLRALEMREHTGRDWGFVNTVHNIRWDHSNLPRSKITSEHAKHSLFRQLNFLKEKLLRDLKTAEKLFVYRVFDHVLTVGVLRRLARAVNRYGDNTLLYVTHSTSGHPPFSVEKVEKGLMIGYIDYFAPRFGGLDYNNYGWEAVCRAADELDSALPVEPIGESKALEST